MPDALLYYRRGAHDGSMLRTFAEVDCATMGPERMAAKLGFYARLYRYMPAPPPGTRHQLVVREDWRRRYPLFRRPHQIVSQLVGVRRPFRRCPRVPRLPRCLRAP
ncbi:hypothetical protein ACFW2D_14425 [Streptomyces sp. NPDC058914]|uniref:hypothetical protein n=1 Tax=Streptomyces sp. NPDC058914 TaxID=3346671 RepID=UPI00368CC86E